MLHGVESLIKVLPEHLLDLSTLIVKILELELDVILEISKLLLQLTADGLRGVLSVL